MTYGLNTFSLVFGPEHASRILRNPYQSRSPHSTLPPMISAILRIFQTTDPFFPVLVDTPTSGMRSLKAFLGLPLIAPTLLLARSKRAEPIFTLLPLGYFMFQHDIRAAHQWPPSPGLVFVTLPYIRSLYNALYIQNFGELEKQWDRAIMRKPREGETVRTSRSINYR
jgi:hypothetical protein